MEVILRDHVENLGKRGEVVKVADGYARNYLLPRKLALPATDANKKWIARERKIAEAREGEERGAAEALADRLVALDLQIAPQGRRQRHAVRLGDQRRHRRPAQGEGLRHRSPQDPAARRDCGARRGARAGEAASRRDGAAEGHGRQSKLSRAIARSNIDAEYGHACSALFFYTARSLHDLKPSSPQDLTWHPKPQPHPPQRTLPHNLEAERSVLGAILIDNEAFNVAAAMIDAKAFFRDAHRRIFERMLDLSERSQPIDLVTLKEELERAGELEEVGGPAYIASLVDGVPRSTNVEYYAQIVKEKATLRNLIFSANKILGNAYEADQEADLILDEAESAIFAVAEDRIKAGFVSMRQLVRESFPKIEKLFEHKTLHHRRADRLRRHRSQDARLPARRPDHRRGAPVDGQDQPGAQHLPARRHARRRRRLLQPGNVEGVAVHAHARIGSEDRHVPADERADRPEGIRADHARDGDR